MQPKRNKPQERKTYSGKSPTSVSSLVSSILKVEQISEKAQSFDFFKDWEEIIGKELYHSCRPLKLNKGTLTIETIDAAYIQELSLKQNEIKKSIANLGYAGLVSKINFISSNTKSFKTK